jgi:16S rRNA (guanine527-N7)-methyltransferase
MSLIGKIEAAASILELKLLSQQAQQLADYLTLLQKWNAAYNLSAIKEPEQLLVKHVFDCLAVVQPIHAQLTHSLSTMASRETIAPSILDVGSGAGLPGIVLAICLPQVQITMVDAVQKKMTFVRQAIGQLQLTNAQAHGTRIQDWQLTYPLVTARAWTALADIPALAGHCVAQGGSIAAMKGPRLAQEALGLTADWQLDRVEDIAVPQLNEPRTLAFLSRKAM